MSTNRIAIRYATPLLELAIEQKIEDKVKADMDSFLSLCESNRDFLLMLKSPVIPHLRKAGIIKKVFEGKVQDLTTKFFEVIVKKNRENVLAEVAEKFLSLYNQKKGFQEALVTTAIALDKNLKKEVESIVKNLTGKEPLLKEEVNPEIIGGYELTIGDRKIDASVNGQLRALKLKFSKENN
mgnify:CR=1 FL=1